MTTYVSSSYSLSSVMFSYILVQMPRHSPQPVEHSNPALRQEQRRVSPSLGGYESRWKIEFGFEYFTGNHERRHLEEGISISFACTVYMD